MPDTAHLTGSERKKLLSALAEAEVGAQIVAGPRSVGRPRVDEVEAYLKEFLKGQDALVIKVAVLALVHSFTPHHIAGKLQLPIEEIKRAFSTAVKVIQQKLEKSSH